MYKGLKKMIYRIKYIYKLISPKYNILLYTPVHGNLGDHAIALAELNMFKKLGVSVLEISAPEYKSHSKLIRILIPKGKTIFVQGGGFLGILWEDEELMFRNIVKSFPYNKIVVLPQTATFDLLTDKGRVFFEESKKVYLSHNNITFFLRDQMSYDFFCVHLPEVKCYCVPDIVASYASPSNYTKRTGALLCMRGDHEKILTEDGESKIKNILQKVYPNMSIEYTDTVISDLVFPFEREQVVKKKLNQFAKSQIVITDRLHGMFFSVITGTPCIAMSNINGKVQGAYKWIDFLDYIKFADSVDEMETKLNELDLNKQYEYRVSDIYDKYDELINCIKSVSIKIQSH